MMKENMVRIYTFFCVFLVYPFTHLYADDAAKIEVEQSSIASSLDYRLRPSDILQIKVFQEEDLTREVSVSQDYTVSLPLIGTVNVRNTSARKLEDDIRRLYDRDFLVNPQVSLIVVRYAERSVNVMGSVNQPQAVAFPPEKGLTLLDAITRAGGFSRLGDRTNVRVRRNNDKGVSETYIIDVNSLIEGKSTDLWFLQVDDVVVVKEKFI
jgi:polysaccharide biosynthesis/export protein